MLILARKNLMLLLVTLTVIPALAQAEVSGKVCKDHLKQLTFIMDSSADRKRADIEKQVSKAVDISLSELLKSDAGNNGNTKDLINRANKVINGCASTCEGLVLGNGNVFRCELLSKYSIRKISHGVGIISDTASVENTEVIGFAAENANFADEQTASETTTQTTTQTTANHDFDEDNFDCLVDAQNPDECATEVSQNAETMTEDDNTATLSNSSSGPQRRPVVRPNDFRRKSRLAQIRPKTARQVIAERNAKKAKEEAEEATDSTDQEDLNTLKKQNEKLRARLLAQKRELEKKQRQAQKPTYQSNDALYRAYAEKLAREREKEEPTKISW